MNEHDNPLINTDSTNSEENTEISSFNSDSQITEGIAETYELMVDGYYEGTADHLVQKKKK
ncbi:hypothetical protein [Heyndrickxia ginsengihumi]|uniref:DUF4025 domain-containing protein n=1 Tax=Heyndrickxia ginsengihumi TaxID=363870 RepID=A0A0A6V9H0_9BACI|nr:hypothetical protein [Heyndrickxia ginsengihumi]KHD84213.1 hypothetical protein NG54_17000 [Heyndrickxia ginsengihumi]MBE6184052.1 hypothetical protein [Bacillus sp. (in: firmicutes)]MCM3024573.1 hypothetical protein [Heyndrickxia ginsengihumi]NEY18782.1 hypothetical protein [Heyndrickxia ginsengihumi]